MALDAQFQRGANGISFMPISLVENELAHRSTVLILWKMWLGLGSHE
jgi:hypothetical protein